jgi:hypothetical protein
LRDWLGRGCQCHSRHFGLPLGGQGFARAKADRKDGAHRYFLPRRHQDAGDGPRLASLDGDDRLVGFDVDDILAW